MSSFPCDRIKPKIELFFFGIVKQLYAFRIVKVLLTLIITMFM